MYEMTEKVRYSELDMTGRFSLKALLNLYQDCATMHSHDAGYTVDWLMSNKRGWVLTSYQTHMYRMPALGEVLRVKTASVKAKGFIGHRVFFLEDEAGRLLSEGYSEWVYMDIASYRPVRVSQDMMDSYHIDDIPVDKWGSRKINVSDNGTSQGSFKAESFLLDTNGHMNNIYYVEACEWYTKGYDFNHLRAEYKRSARLGDELFVKEHASEESRIFSLDDAGGEPFFIVEFSNRSDWK